MTDDSVNRTYKAVSWALFTAVVLIPFFVWAEVRSWRLSSATALSLFPLLGIWAWSIMWTHYILGTWRIFDSRLVKDPVYRMISKVAVLFLILLHPGLLIWNQWKVRNILPPESIYGYVDSSLKIFVFFGTLSLLIFLSFDILETFRKKSWVNKNWRWVSLSQMLAMTLIFLHALALGNILQNSWFEFYWFILGALLIPCFGLIGRLDWQKTK